jgi:hypothetical protein
MEFIQDLASVWPGYCAVASMIPNVTFLILNGLFGHRYDKRLLSLNFLPTETFQKWFLRYLRVLPIDTDMHKNEPA